MQQRIAFVYSNGVVHRCDRCWECNVRDSFCPRFLNFPCSLAAHQFATSTIRSTEMDAAHSACCRFQWKSHIQKYQQLFTVEVGAFRFIYLEFAGRLGVCATRDARVEYDTFIVRLLLLFRYTILDRTAENGLALPPFVFNFLNVLCWPLSRLSSSSLFMRF